MIQTAHDEQGQEYYDAIFARCYVTRGYYPLYEQVLGMIEQPGPPRGVLEIGCGVGDLGRMIVERGYPYRGFDFSPVAVECSRRLCPEAQFATGDAYSPSAYLPHDYDTAVALEVLEHLDDLRIIENIPTGVRLIASVPDYDDVAHLRLYQDPHRDIVERFRPLLKVTSIVSLSRQVSKSDTRTIYVFEGLRVESSVNATEVEGTNTPKVGRNDPCPCGSGLKYKRCCLP